MSSSRSLLLLVGLSLAACEPEPAVPGADGGVLDGGALDAAAPDGGARTDGGGSDTCPAPSLACGELCLSEAALCDGFAQCPGGEDESSEAGCTSCDGCMQGDLCVAGTIEVACGSGGAACAACDAGEECADGECLAPPACQPSTCARGCCAGDSCEAGTSESACGSGGAACERCAAGASCVADASGALRCRLPCNASTCSGCCMPDGTCAAGSLDSTACGRGGEACAECTGTTTCGGGACVTDACLASCPGCCRADGMCEEDSDTGGAQCGYRGGLCRQCPLTAECAGGGCVDSERRDACPDGCLDTAGVCQSGESPTACGTGGRACQACGDILSCTNRGCDIPFGTTWDLILYTATVPATDEDGAAWDAFGGLPDLSVALYAFADPSGGGLWTRNEASSTVSDTLSADWGGVVLASELDRQVLYVIRLTVNDVDVLYHDPIDSCSVNTDLWNPVQNERLFGGEIQECHTDEGVIIRWQLRPHIL